MLCECSHHLCFIEFLIEISNSLLTYSFLLIMNMYHCLSVPPIEASYYVSANCSRLVSRCWFIFSLRVFHVSPANVFTCLLHHTPWILMLCVLCSQTIISAILLHLVISRHIVSCWSVPVSFSKWLREYYFSSVSLNQASYVNEGFPFHIMWLVHVVVI